MKMKREEFEKTVHGMGFSQNKHLLDACYEVLVMGRPQATVRRTYELDRDAFTRTLWRIEDERARLKGSSDLISL